MAPNNALVVSLFLVPGIARCGPNPFGLILSYSNAPSFFLVTSSITMNHIDRNSPQYSSVVLLHKGGSPSELLKISANYTHPPQVGARVSFLNARTQQSETGVVTAIQDRLSDGTVIVTIQRDQGGIVQLPVAALQPA
ncbi:hypothetical protein BU17DRAFT_92291 [Hysterangium stoloniferum]|nr:hypothetical protein BU17DRAFT_92291 [Hysterangium stoloniferum]